jgi:hypothetical protein
VKAPVYGGCCTCCSTGYMLAEIRDCMKWLKGLDDDNKVFFIDSWAKSGFSGILLDTIGNFDELEDLPHELNKWTEIMNVTSSL